MTDHRPTIKPFLSLMEGYRSSKILTTAAKLGLFSDPFNPVSPETIAQRQGVSLKGARLLLNALVALDIYEKHGKTFVLTPDIRQLLKTFPGLTADFVHHDHLYDVWGRLEEGIRSGKSVSPTEEEIQGYPDTLETFLQAMHAHASYLAPEILAKIPWQDVHSLLDIGGGGGGYALAFVQAMPDLNITLVDLPDAISVTQRMIAPMAGAERVALHSCNAYLDPLPEGPFDRIFIAHLAHLYPTHENRTLIEKAACMLKPGGDLLLVDYFLNEDGTAPKEAVLFRLLMMIGTPEGDCYSFSEALWWISSSGLTSHETISLRRGQTLVRAQKP